MSNFSKLIQDKAISRESVTLGYNRTGENIARSETTSFDPRTSGGPRNGGLGTYSRLIATILSTMTKAKHLSTWLLCIMLFAVLLAACVLDDAPNLEPSSASNVQIGFVNAMRINDSDTLFLLVTLEAWNEVEEWLKHHEAVECGPISILEGEDSIQYFGTIRIDSETKKVGSYSLIRDCPGRSQGRIYELLFEEIVVEKSEGRWSVTSWSGVKEN